MPSAYAYHRQVENSYLVRERDRRRRHELLRVLLGALPLAAALLGYTYLHVRVLDTAYAIGELERELATRERRRAELALEVEQRSALPVVEARARRELGMVTPTAEHTLFWPELGAEPDGAPVAQVPPPPGSAPAAGPGRDGGWP